MTFLGEALGTLELDVSYAPNREAAQGNYTTLLHLGALAPYFVQKTSKGAKLPSRERTTARLA